MELKPFDDVFYKRIFRIPDYQRGYANGSHSEIAVSEYPSWTPLTIKTRGLDMIRFLEQRWGINISSDEERLELLNLSFLQEDR